VLWRSLQRGICQNGRGRWVDLTLASSPGKTFPWNSSRRARGTPGDICTHSHQSTPAINDDTPWQVQQTSTSNIHCAISCDDMHTKSQLALDSERTKLKLTFSTACAKPGWSVVNGIWWTRATSGLSSLETMSSSISVLANHTHTHTHTQLTRLALYINISECRVSLQSVISIYTR